MALLLENLGFFLSGLEFTVRLLALLTLVCAIVVSVLIGLVRRPANGVACASLRSAMSSSGETFRCS